MKVTTSEGLVVRLERAFRQEGFETRSLSNGRECSIDVIKCRKFREFFFIVGTSRHKVADVYINNRNIGANARKNWIIEVFGQEYMNLMETLAKKFAEEFKVSIHVKLVSDEEESLY